MATNRDSDVLSIIIYAHYPAWEDIPIQIAVIGDTFSLDLNEYLDNGDAATITQKSGTSLLTGLILDSNGVISGTPTDSSELNIEVIFIATLAGYSTEVTVCMGTIASGIWSASNSGDGTVHDFCGTWYSIGDIVFYEANCRISDDDDWQENTPILTLPDGSEAANVCGLIQNAGPDFIARVEVQENYTYETLDDFSTSGAGRYDIAIQVLDTEHTDKRIFALYHSNSVSSILVARYYDETFGTWTGVFRDFTGEPGGTISDRRAYFMANDGSHTYLYYVHSTDYQLRRRQLGSATAFGTTVTTLASNGFANAIAFGSIGTTFYQLDNDSTIRTLNISTGALGSAITLDKQLDGLLHGAVATSGGDKLAGWISNNSDPDEDGLYVIDTSDGSVQQINNYVKFPPCGSVDDGIIYTVTNDSRIRTDTSPDIVRFFPSSTTDITLVDSDSDYTPAQGHIDESSDKIRLNITKRVEDENEIIIHIRGSYQKVA